MKSLGSWWLTRVGALGLVVAAGLSAASLQGAAAATLPVSAAPIQTWVLDVDPGLFVTAPEDVPEDVPEDLTEPLGEPSEDSLVPDAEGSADTPPDLAPQGDADPGAPQEQQPTPVPAPAPAPPAAEEPGPDVADGLVGTVERAADSLDG